MTSRKTESKINAKAKTFGGLVASVVKTGQQSIASVSEAFMPGQFAVARTLSC